MTRRTAIPLLVACLSSCATAAPLVVQTDRFSATLASGTVVSLTDKQGTSLVVESAEPRGATIHRIGAVHSAATETGPERLVNRGRVARESADFGDLPGATIQTEYAIEESSGDLIFTQRCQSPERGVWGLEWSLANIPLDLNVIVPGRSGVKLTRQSPGGTQTFDYPLGWEAQLVIVEGEGRGFYLWAEDTDARFKRLTVERGREGWRLRMISMNYAPFDDHTTCDSVKWRLNVYEGDWRVPARRYRDWMVRQFRPTPLSEQRPAWVKDMRCMVIMGLSIPQIEALAARLDPAQTILYVPDWRSAGYDRDYPTYDQVNPELDPFLARAHVLGYRVMLHVNYFGCDPLHPLYEQFEPFQVRSPWGTHEKEWWLWTRAEPEIKFAYINPAHKPWRELFIARMKKLCTDHAVDALHLDQTLCIFNDHNGLMDGVSMSQGNALLHQELREALPEVALSGEGLNEVTYRHEAFAQRHVWGLDHTEGTWDRQSLATAHPVSSYLFRPYTLINGYLGCAPPTNGQLYAAWNEAYEHWGVIPTLKPDSAQIAEPSGFSKQFFEEAAFWQEQRLDPDTDGGWPETVCFPFVTAKGAPVVRMTDGSLRWDDREISRTLTGATEVRLPGTIPGWKAYDQERLFGLDPTAWYPYFPEPRDQTAFHVEELPDGFTVSEISQRGKLAVLGTRQTDAVLAELAALLDDARCGSQPLQGEAYEVQGPLQAPDGGTWSGGGSVLSAHPPWKAIRKNPNTGVTEAGGTGSAWARWSLQLPAEGKLRFTSEVAMEAGAVGEGKTDGVTYGVKASSGDQQATAEIHNATSARTELELDLTPFAGKKVDLELSVHPGPANSATFDWARWHGPKVVHDRAAEAQLVVVSPDKWTLAVAGTRYDPVTPAGLKYRVRTLFPGKLLLLAGLPDAAALPLDLARAERSASFLSDAGVVLDSARFATANASESTVGGTARSGLFAHPPDHGRTVLDYAVTLPQQPAEFHSFLGLRDGSKSEGVLFVVEANGLELIRERMLPGAWKEVTCDLSPWAGKALVLSLITDSDGSFHFDWAQWGDPVLRAK